jgi:hypothetical protein
MFLAYLWTYEKDRISTQFSIGLYEIPNGRAVYGKVITQRDNDYFD